MTPAQLAALKSAILADPILAAKPMTSGGAGEIAEAYKAISSVDVWRSSTPVSDIYDAIDTTKYTPADQPSITNTAQEAALWLNRSQLILIKQAVLQYLLQGKETLNTAKAMIRANLRDAVITIPAGTGGAAISAGGVGGATVLNACKRKANRFEALFATTDSPTGPVTAKLLVLEGEVSSDDIQAARES